MRANSASQTAAGGKRTARTASEAAGIVYIIDGAGESGFTPLVLRRSLSHLPYEIDHFRWGCGYGRVIADLTNRENIRNKANELSERIAKYRQKNAKHKIHVIAKSAGTAIALYALSKLQDNTVDRAILMSPAVSPTFKLTPALRAVSDQMYCFWSPTDLFYLWLGTSLYGTADGAYSHAAGLTGFIHLKEGEGAEEYRKLTQIKWTPQMIKLLHPGSHWGNSMPPFVKKHIVPLLELDAEVTS